MRCIKRTLKRRTRGPPAAQGPLVNKRPSNGQYRRFWLVSVIERLVLVFGVQFLFPGLETGSVKHRRFWSLGGEEGEQATAGPF